MEIQKSELEKFGNRRREECGILIEKDGSVTIKKLKNSAKKNFEYGILASDLIKALKELSEGEKAVGFIHTHLPKDSPEPSEKDYEGRVFAESYKHCVYHVKEKTLVWY